MRLRRRTALLAPLALPFATHAEAPWPNQPIKLVVPYPPGAVTDALGRLVAERLQTAFHQPVIVDNKPGAATQVGASFVAKQPPDGYTLLLATVSTLCITPALYAKPLIAYTDFAPVAFLGNVLLILVCRPTLPVNTVQELMALLKSKPDTYTYGSPGTGTVHHLLVELLRNHEHFSATHVPYVGSTKAMVDLMEGRFDFMFLDATAALEQIRAGKLKALAVTGTKRSAALPDVPALIEVFPGFDHQPWMSIVGPRGLPAALSARLNAAINDSLADPIFVGRLRDIGVEASPLTLAAFGDFIARDAGRWAELVKISGAKAE